MIYKQIMISMSEAQHNFKIYRVIRLLYTLRVIKDDELMRHEDTIRNTSMIGMDIDWENYRMLVGDEIIQF